MTPYLVLLAAVAALAALGIVLARGRSVDRQGFHGDIKNVPRSYPSIQAAINAAGEGDAVVIQPGIYTEDIMLGGVDITVRGRDPGDHEVVAATVIRGTGRGPVITFEENISRATVLEGVTVTGGSGRRPRDPGSPGPRTGGGIYVSRSCSPTIRRTVVTGNTAGTGGGIYIEIGSGCVVEDCTVTGNEAHMGAGLGVAGEETSALEPEGPRGQPEFADRKKTDLLMMIAGNRITGNRASFGGGLALSGRGKVRVEGNTISANTAGLDGGGVTVWDGAGFSLTGNGISGNTAGEDDLGFGGGLSVVRSVNTVVRGNVIEGNRALGSLGSGGGGVSVHKSDIHMDRNRVTANTAGHGGGVLVWAHSHASLERNTIRKNRADGVALSATSRITGDDASRTPIRTGLSDLPGGDGTPRS